MTAAALLYLAFFALAARMQRHAPALLGPWRRPAVTLYLPIAGWTLFALSLVTVLLTPDWPRALVGWCGALPLAAGLVLLGLTYSSAAARIGVLVALLLLAVSLLA